MAAIYMSQAGYDAYNARLAEKINEHKQTYDARIEALREVRVGDMNDPEIVQLRQLEDGLSTTIKQMQDILGSTQIIHFDDHSRPVGEVRIGSIVRIQRMNGETGIKMPHEVWEIAGYDETDLKKRQLAYNSPLGSRMLSAMVGETIEDVAVGGGLFDIEIIRLYLSWDEL